MIDPETVTEARIALGRQLAAHREAAGLRQAQLAPLVLYGRSTVANVETGRQTCSRAFWERADKVLGANGVLLRGYDELQALERALREATARTIRAEREARFRSLDSNHVDHLQLPDADQGTQTGELAIHGPPVAAENWAVDAEHWRRRDFETLAARLLAETPTADNALRLAHEWLIADPPQVYEVRAGRRIGKSTVERVVARVHQLRLLDDHLGGTSTYDVVTGELAATAAMLRAASYTDAVGRRLLVAIGELCQITGWVASDSGRHVEAERLYLAGVRAAHAGHDAAGAANNLSSLSYQVANIGDPREAVTLARSAVRGAAGSASATTRALLLERLSWALARAREASQAERSLGEVEDTYAKRRPDDDPLWTYWLSYDEVEVMAGRVWTELRRPLRAVPILERATAGYDENAARETSLYLTWLAESLLQAREVERAAAEASRALRLSHRAGSVRADERVQALRRLLIEYRGTRAADDFEDEYLASLGQRG